MIIQLKGQYVSIVYYFRAIQVLSTKFHMEHFDCWVKGAVYCLCNGFNLSGYESDCLPLRCVVDQLLHYF